MPKRLRDHDDVLFECLKDPREAADYLNAALEDSDEMFLEALRDIASSAKMASVAERAGVARQAMYRMLGKQGNPTFSSLMAILRALNLRFAIEGDIVATPTGPPVDATGQGVHLTDNDTPNEPPEETDAANAAFSRPAAPLG